MDAIHSDARTRRLCRSVPGSGGNTSKKVHTGTYQYPVPLEPEIFPGTHIHLRVGSRSAGSGGRYLGNVPLIDKNFSLGKISSRLNETSVFLYNVSLFNGSGRTQP